MSVALIGIVDQAISKNDKVTWDVNKIGGPPVWLNQTPSTDLLLCPKCGREMSLLCQLYSPLGDSPYHRCLYVFICLNQGCINIFQFKVFRCVKYDSSYVPSEGATNSQSSEHSMQMDTWLDDQDEWGEDDSCWTDDVEGECLPERSCTAASIMPSHESEAMKIHKGAYDLSSPSSSFSYPLDLPADLSKMTLSDQDHPHSGALNDNSNDSQSTTPFFTTPPNEKDGVVSEDIGPQDKRYEELALLLNTKFVDTNGLSSSDQTNHMESLTTFDPYYLYVIEEPQGRDEKVSKHIADLIKDYEKNEGKQLGVLMDEGLSKGKSTRELYEKSEIKHGDKIFHKFHKRLQNCPEQCIRYHRGGDPLLAKELQEESCSVMPCHHCGSPRIFELQLLPALIPWLTISGHASCVEFSTVLIFTCRNNCRPTEGDGKLLEEVAICQEDPDQHLFR